MEFSISLILMTLGPFMVMVEATREGLEVLVAPSRSRRRQSPAVFPSARRLSLFPQPHPPSSPITRHRSAPMASDTATATPPDAAPTWGRGKSHPVSRPWLTDGRRCLSHYFALSLSSGQKTPPLHSPHPSLKADAPPSIQCLLPEGPTGSYLLPPFACSSGWMGPLVSLLSLSTSSLTLPSPRLSCQS